LAKVLIIYHSQSGNTKAMAKAIYDGAIAAGATATLKKAGDTVAADIFEADAIAVGTPNYFSYMAGMIKDMLDRVWFAIKGNVDGKSYALFTSAGGPNPVAISKLDELFHVLSWEKVSEDVVGQGDTSPTVLQKCRETGTRLAQS
jgi:flavorubredoxin